MAYVWRDILDEFDMWLTDGCQIKPRSSLMVDNLMRIGDNFFSGTMVLPAGVSTACVINDFMKFRSDQASDDCKILWDIRDHEPLRDTRYILKGIGTFPVSS